MSRARFCAPNLFSPLQVKCSVNFFSTYSFELSFSLVEELLRLNMTNSFQGNFFGTTLTFRAQLFTKPSKFRAEMFSKRNLFNFSFDEAFKITLCFPVFDSVSNTAKRCGFLTFRIRRVWSLPNTMWLVFCMPETMPL